MNDNWGGPWTLTAVLIPGPELRCQALSGFPATYVLAGLAGLAGSGRLWPPLRCFLGFLGFLGFLVFLVFRFPLFDVVVFCSCSTKGHFEMFKN